MKYNIKILIFSLTISIIISGCTFKDNKSKEDNILDNSIVDEDIQEEISLDVSGKDYDLLIRSEGISDAVVNLYGVDNVTSIIFNDKVAVAIEMADGHEFTTDVKESVIHTAKEKDSNISEIFVSEDKKVFNDIEDVIEALLNGKPYDGEVDRINKIIDNIKK